MAYHTRALGLATALALAPMVAPAATVDINIQSFGAGKTSADISGAIAGRAAFMGSSPIIGEENFETGFTTCDKDSGTSCTSAPVKVGTGSGQTPISTAVGDFWGIGPAHTNLGGSRLEPTGEIVVRNDNPGNTYGRYDVDGDSNWLDSNDLNGIKWEIPGSTGLSNILKIAFFLTDMDDVGSTPFKINVADQNAPLDANIQGIQGKRPDGELLLVTMLFSEPVPLLSIEMTTGKGDGFGMDGIQVGTVPLPASALLLLGGLGGLGGLSALRRRKRPA